MKRIMIVLGIVGALAGAAIAADVVCPIHTYSPCYNTGAVQNLAKKYHCTCGDDVWVRSR